MKKICFFLLLFISHMHARSQVNHLVISQVYGGGGNSGAVYLNDFIEIFNPTPAPVTLTGWSVQYAGATGTGSWNVTNLSGSINPGKYYLVQEASSGAIGVALPAPDVTGSINMSATAGKVALLNTTTVLNGACPATISIIDLVGYGSTANCFETSPAGGLNSTTSAQRMNNGCVDVNNNSSDFLVAAPIPRNSSSAVNSCGQASLPVSLMNFSGYHETDRNILKWTTESEQSCLGFYIESSTDGNRFNSIGFTSSLANNGNSSAELHYSFTHIYPGGSNQYYRLRQVDLGGTATFSHIILIREIKPTVLLIDDIFPNPARQTMNMVIEAPGRGPVTLIIFDMNGKQLRQQECVIETGVNTIQVDVSQFVNGTYTIRLVDKLNGETAITQFLKR